MWALEPASTWLLGLYGTSQMSPLEDRSRMRCLNAPHFLVLTHQAATSNSDVGFHAVSD